LILVCNFYDLVIFLTRNSRSYKHTDTFTIAVIHRFLRLVYIYIIINSSEGKEFRGLF
jgi:hypothetical protein